MIDMGVRMPSHSIEQGDSPVGILATEYASEGYLYRFHTACFFRLNKDEQKFRRIRAITRSEAEEHEYHCDRCKKLLYESVF